MPPSVQTLCRTMKPRKATMTMKCLVLSALVVFLFPQGVGAAGLTFVPDAKTADIHPARPNLSVLTYPVPGGLLVADRLAPGAETRYGKPFLRREPDSDFFLVQGKGHPHDVDEMRARLQVNGHIHWQGGGAFLVEVAARDLPHFAAQHIDRVRIPLTPPPSGWDRPHRDPSADATGHRETADLIQDFVANFSQPAFGQVIQEISGNAYFFYNGLKSVTTRYYSTADKDLIAEYLASKLTTYGYDVTFDEFMSGGVTCRNVVATRTGTTLPDEYVVVGAHYDSISQSPTINAPGAEDNGSGTAAVMEIARLAADRDFERTVQFVLFDSEEQGLYGSYHFVQDATAAGRDIIAAITLDMVAYFDANYAVRIEGETPWEWLMATMETYVGDLTDISSQKDYNSWGSDHVPFQQAGIPAFLAIDYDYGVYPGYHQTSDVWSQIEGTYHLGSEIGKACAATLADVAGLQPDVSAAGDVPTTVAIDLVAYPNPFNPRVTILFEADRDLDGEMAVYDLTGRKIAVLRQGRFSQGLNRMQWNGRDRAGRAMSSGTYVCRLQAGDRTKTVNINLVR